MIIHVNERSIHIVDILTVESVYYDLRSIEMTIIHRDGRKQTIDFHQGDPLELGADAWEQQNRDRMKEVFEKIKSDSISILGS